MVVKSVLSALLIALPFSNAQFAFFSGVKTNFSLTEYLTAGWKPCLDITYDDYVSNFTATLDVNCTGEYLMLGCYVPPDYKTIVVGAMGLKSVVLTQTARPLKIVNDRYRSSNIHNNVSWYFTDDYSVGEVVGDGLLA